MPRFFGKRKTLSKPDALELAQKEIEYSIQYRDQLGTERKWRTIIDAYEGRYLERDQTDFEDEIVINYAFATANVIWPSVSIKEPTISILPRSAENEDRAILTEALLNYEWERLGVQKPFRAACWDYVTLGIGWTKVGWEYREVARPMTEEEEIQEISSRLIAEDERAVENPLDPTLLTDEQIADQVTGSRITETVLDDPYVDYVSPFDVFVNAEATTLEDARWIAHRQIRTLEEAKADKTYNQRVRSKLTAESVLEPGKGMTYRDQRRYGDSIDRVVIWEFWDLERNKLMAFSEQSPDFLVAPRDIPYHMGHPFRMIRNYTSTDKFYPQGDLEQIIPLVHELNAGRSQMLNHRRKGNRKWIAREEAFNERSRKALESSQDNQVVMIEKSFQGDLNDVIAPMPQIPLQADMYAIDNRIQDDINIVSGVSEYQRGSGGDTRQTATEAALIQDATNARQAEKLSQVEVFISEIAAALLQIMQQFMQEHRDVRVVGPLGGDPLWFAAEPDDIIGEYLFKVQAGSTQPTNETTRRTNAITAMQMLGPWVQQGLVDPVQLLKHVMVEGLDIRQPEKLFTPPAVQQLAQQRQALQASGQDPAENGGGGGGGQGLDANNPDLQGGQGVNAPQLDPREILSLQQSAQTVNGLPSALSSQLEGQVGVNF